MPEKITTEYLEEMMKRYEGMSEDDLLEELGRELVQNRLKQEREKNPEITEEEALRMIVQETEERK